MCSTGVAIGHMRTFALLSTFVDETGNGTLPPQQSIADAIHATVRTVQNHLCKLASAGLIAIFARGSRRNAPFRVCRETRNERPETRKAETRNAFPARARVLLVTYGDSFSGSPEQATGHLRSPSSNVNAQWVKPTAYQPMLDITLEADDLPKLDLTITSTEAQDTSSELTRHSGSAVGPKGRPLNPDYEYWVSICQILGLDHNEIVRDRSAKATNLKLCKQLRAMQASLAEIQQLVVYLRSRTWYTAPITVFTVRKEITPWRALKRPATEQSARAPQAQPRFADGRLKPVI